MAKSSEGAINSSLSYGKTACFLTYDIRPKTTYIHEFKSLLQLCWVGFLTLHFSIYLSVHVSISKISQKVFLGGPFL